MSLVCYECHRDMKPSQTFPGREGTLVYPVVHSIVYVPMDGGTSYELTYLKAPDNLAVCFECFEKGIGEKESSVLKSIYKAYELENDFEIFEEERKLRGLDSNGMESWSKAFNEYKKASDAIRPGCLFCGDDVRNGNPFFIAMVINKVYSSKHLTFGTNYSWSNMKEGMTGFEICFEDFRKQLPRTFEQLSYSMLGRRNPSQKIEPGELYVSPEVEKAFEQETGETFDDFIDRMMKDGIDNLRIVRRKKSEDF